MGVLKVKLNRGQVDLFPVVRRVKILLVGLLVLSGSDAFAQPFVKIAQSPEGARYFCEAEGGVKGRVWRQMRGEETPRAVRARAERRRLMQVAAVSNARRSARFRKAAERVGLGCGARENQLLRPPATATPIPPVPRNPDGSPTPRPTATPTVIPIPPDFVSEVTYNGITFTFDKPYPHGTFITGDYWVVGPVTITAISPAFTGTRNGFEVAPMSPAQQGFDYLANGFNAARVPALPITVAPGRAVVKTVGRDEPIQPRSHAKIRNAAILSVLSEPPPADAFRPGYAAINQPIYRLSQLKLNRLPSLSFSGTRQALSVTKQRFSKPWIDHLSDWGGRSIHPFEHMPDYGSDITIHTNEAALRLMLDDPIEARREAMIGYIQYGIDLRSMLRIGTLFHANGGHCQGRVLPLAFTAVLLDAPEFSEGLDILLDRHHESGSVVAGVEGQALWGQPRTGNERAYWRNQLADRESRSIPDPYGYIDGGKTPGGFYDFCCNAQGFKGITLAFHLFPAMREYWNNQLFFEYAKRWVSFGAWTQPDPCAPVDPRDVTACNAEPNKSNCQLTYYGVTYGPNGSGGCILDTDPADGVGRYPTLHGSNRDGGYYGSAFVSALWNVYPPSQ